MSPKDHLLNSAAQFGEHTTAHFTALACAGTLELVCLPTIDILVDKVHHLSSPEILALFFVIFGIGWGAAHLRLQQFFKTNRPPDPQPVDALPMVITTPPVQAVRCVDGTPAVIVIVDPSRVKEAADGVASIIAASRGVYLPPAT